MKKILYTVLLGVLLYAGISAQSVMYYKFSHEQGSTYTSLTEATAISKTMDAPKDKFPLTVFNATESFDLTVKNDTMVDGIPLGFDFTFEGKTYDKFVVFGMGYIYLGEKSSPKVHVNPGSADLYGLFRQVPGTIGVSTRVQDTCRAAVQYKMEGTDGNKTATVEFSMGYNGVAPGTVFHYQVKLYEAGGKIEMLFDDFDVSWGGRYGECFVVGISGEKNTYYMDPVAGDFGNVTRSTTNGWTSLSALKFQKGLKYTFLPPDNCVAPDATGATISAGAAGSAHVLLNLGVTENQADAYIVVASENPITENPADETSYKVGDNLAGGKVLAVNEDWQDKTEFKVEHSDKYKNELKPDTKYYYAAWLYNYKCSGGVKYSTAPVKTEVTTRTAAPKALNFVSVNKTEIKLNMDADDAGSDVLVAVTNVHGHGNHVSIVLMQGNFGIPADNAREGDTIKDENGGFAGKVLYVGKAENAQITYPVTDNKIYHFGAFRKGTDGQYSTLFAAADTITPAVIPFSEDFSNMIPFSIPVGWTGTDPEFAVSSRGGSVARTFPQASSGAARQTTLDLPPMSYPAKALRLVMTYNMNVYEGWVQGGYKRTHWAETDSIVFEVSKDGGNVYSPVYAITKLNANEFSSPSEYLSRAITIKGFESTQQAKLRLRWRSLQQNSHTLTIQSIRVIEVPDCDYPISVSIDPATVVADEASVQWEPGESGESAWNISYALKNGSTWSEWSQAQQVSTNPFLLTDLASNSIYKVRVQSVCGVGQTSEWVESSEFTSGWVVPFVEDFNNVPIVGSGYMRSPDFPNGWNAFLLQHNPGDISDTLKTADMREASFSTRDVYYYNWKGSNATPGSGNGSLAYPMFWSQGTILLCLPTLRLDENDAADFVFSAAYGTYTYPAFSKVTRTDTAYKMYLFVSTDGGNVFALKDTVKSWDSAALVAFGDSTAIRVSLEEYKGQEVVLALAVSSGVYNAQVQNDYLWIDNMGVVYPCGTAKSLKIENIEKTTASLTWKADPMVEEWIVKAVNTDTTTFTAVQQNSVVLQNLDSATYYTVYVGHLCGEDTSDWASVSFTTAGVQCEPISNLVVSEITRTTAKLTWNGDAMRYRIRLRKAGSPDAYVVYTSENEEYSFTALLPGTEYEGGVQSICGEAAADTSAYVAFENFTTTAITCFAPTNLAASELTFHSAKLSWEGAAQNYQLAYRREATTTVLGNFNVAGKEYVLSGLDAVTPYEVRVRSICGEGDTSAYCDWVSFTTTTVPPCPAPADLKAENITVNSAELSWTCSDAEAGFILRYRPSSATVWDSVKNLEQNKHLLNNLQPKTAYLWSVMATCSDNRASGWATASNFTTLEETAVENPLAAKLQVRAGKGQIHIINLSAMPVDRVRVYDVDGTLLENYRVGGSENIILTTRHSMRVVIVAVESGKQVMRYKVLLP